MAQTIIVSNRLPVSVKKTAKGLEFYPSGGGLATGLGSYANKRGTLWIGWPGIISDELTDEDKQIIIDRLRAYRCSPVFLSRQQLERFYNGYSNALLWPLLHTLPTDHTNAIRDWKAYRLVNDLFSEAVLAQSSPDSSVWVHDYQLMLLPRLLRLERPAASIGFFLHIPFPKASQLNRLKQARELVTGLLGADLVGFHTNSYANNFLNACAELNIGTPSVGGLAVGNRVVRVTEFPIGIDYNKFALSGRTRGVQKHIVRLKRKYKGKKVILTVDRLDPTKGFLERLKAYQVFLATHPNQHSKVQLVMLAVPSRSEVAAYKKLKRDVEKLVSSINKTYSTRSWRPVEFRYESVTFEELSALYRVADVGFISPIRDGMNLVAKEFIASQSGHQGMLILSETAGAAEELKDALLVNPKRPRNLSLALERALTMSRAETRKRLRTMRQKVAANTIHDWAGSYMRSLSRATASNRSLAFAPMHLRQLGLAYSGATSKLLLLDYDGVITPFTAKPEQAKPTTKLRKTLEALANDPTTDIAIVSGRDAKTLESWLGDLPITLIAEHGACQKPPGKSWQELAPHSSWIRTIKPVLERFAAQTPGAFVEEKTYSLVWHYRNAKPYAAQKSLAQMQQVLPPQLRKFGVKFHRGHKIIEIKDPGINKGSVVEHLLVKPYDFILAIGDDFTDEEMFKALPKSSYTVKVGPGKTAARYRIKDVALVRDLLNHFAK